jgi:hypothetical protein
VCRCSAVSSPVHECPPPKHSPGIPTGIRSHLVDDVLWWAFPPATELPTTGLCHEKVSFLSLLHVLTDKQQAPIHPSHRVHSGGTSPLPHHELCHRICPGRFGGETRSGTEPPEATPIVAHCLPAHRCHPPLA